MTLLDIAADIEELLRKFNPSQPRDDEGKWSAFGGIPAFAKELSFFDGTVSALVDQGGLKLKLTNRRGGENRSGGLSSDSRWELADLLQAAAEWDADGGDGYPGGGDEPRMVGKSVYTYPDNGDDQATATGYAQVTHDGTGNIELELLDSDEPIRLTRPEAGQLSKVVRRSAAVSRISLPSGPLDIYPTDDNKVGLRLNGTDGSVRELTFTGKSWMDVHYAMDIVTEGSDESELFVKAVPDANGDIPDVNSLEIDTSVGRVRVSREGPAWSYAADETTNGTAKVTVAAVDGSWSFKRIGTFESDPAFEAFQAFRELADIPGLERSTHAHAGRAYVRPAVRAIVRDLLRKFNPDQPRDPDGKFSKISVIKNALAALAGDDARHITSKYGTTSFPDRDGVDANRDVEWEVDDDGNYNVTFHSDGFGLDEDAARPAISLDGQAFSNLTDQIGLTLLAAEKPPFDPNDRGSMLLHSVLANTQGAAHYNDDETYIDISASTGGVYGLEFDGGEGGEALSMELSRDDLARLHASMLLTLMAQRPWLRAVFGSRRREFSEAKVKRDRKGRFAKKMAAAEVLGEMDALMAKLGELMKSSGVDDDEKSDLDVAMDYMKMARRSREARGDEDTHDGSSDLDTAQYHSLEVNPDPNDGTVVIDHDSGGFWMSAADAEDMAQAIDEFDDITIPDGKTYSDVIAEKVSASGDVKAVLWGSGTIEIGGVEGFDDDENNLVIDPSDPDDARNVADALEEAAAAALKGAGK